MANIKRSWTPLTTMAVAVGVGASTLGTGCLKPTLSAADSIRTGAGANSQFLLPRVIDQEDGTQAFCVYVAKPSDDPSSFEKIGPGNTQDVRVITQQAIPQGEFIANLRDPALMGAAGGVGNTIANDVMTGLATASLGAAGLTTAVATQWASRGGPQARQVWDQSIALKGTLIEADALLGAEMTPVTKDIAEALTRADVPKIYANQLAGIIADASPGDSAALQKFVQKLGANTPNNNARLMTLFERRKVLGLGGGNPSPADIKRIREGIEKAFIPKAPSDIVPTVNLGLLDKAAKLQHLQQRIAAGAGEIRDQLSGLGRALSSGNSADQNQAIEGVSAYLDSAQTQLDSLLKQDALSAAGVTTKTRQLVALGQDNPTRGRLRLFPRAVPSGPSSPARSKALTKLGLEAKDFKRTLVGAAPDADDSAKATRTFKDTFGDLCYRGGGAKAVAAKVLGCSLTAGVGSVFMKKALFEPGTMTIKRDQIAQSLTAENAFMEVNEASFRAIEDAIRGFATESDTTRCQ